MPNGKKIKVALVTPPISGHQIRGTGEYTQRLYVALKKNGSIAVDLVNFKDKKDDFDLIHYPYFDPFFLTLPFFAENPTVVTVHDLIPLKFPKFFPAGVRGTIKWRIQRLSLRNSTVVVTDSFASKEDIVNFTAINKDKILVIYLGAGEEYKLVKQEDQLKQLQTKLKIPAEFILHVGDVNYNKNISGILQAFKIATDSFPSLNLVLVGSGFISPSPQLDEMLGLISCLRISDKVYRLSHVTQKELAGLYNLAKIYLQPSFAEGFGLPVLEAMACGCPVITSNKSCLPEIAADAAVSVDPHDYQSIAKNIVELLNDKGKYSIQTAKGLARVKLFSWGKCAAEIVKVYKSVVENLSK